MKGYVYILTNEAMPGLVKIGRSKHAAAGRAEAMYRGDTGVPLPFDIYFECLFDDCIEAEKLAHEELAHLRINPNREFFRVCPDEATLCVMHIKAVAYDHGVAPLDTIIDPSVYHCLARDLDAHFGEIVSAFNEVTADELAPALGRWRDKVEKTRQKRETTQAQVIELTDYTGVA